MDNDISQQIVPQENSEKIIYKKASFWARVFAFIIDQIIIGVPYYILLFIFPEVKSDIIFSVLIYDLYAIWFIWKKGATPGKMLMKIQVVSDRYQPLRLGQAVFRETIGKFLSGIFDLGYLWVLLDKKKQAWHDKLAHTFVIKVDNVKNLIPVIEDELVTRKQKVTFGILLFLSFVPLLTTSVLLYIYIALFRPFQITGDAMFPNYTNHEFVLTGIRHEILQRGDVIVFTMPNNPNKDRISRIIGMPGEKIMIVEGNVYINQHRLDESKYLNSGIKTVGGAFLSKGELLTVPDNHYFVLGDNRFSRNDSREWGFMPKKNVISKVLICYSNCPAKK